MLRGESPRTRPRGWLACALVLIAGCSGGARSTGSGAETKLTIAITARTVTPGSEPILLTAQNASGPVAWKLQGPGGLSATAGVESSYVPPATLAAAAVATVSATCGGTQATVTIDVLPDASAITVDGLVLDEDGNPITTEAVLVPGRPATATDSAGRFTIAGVVPPYDLVVVKGDQRIAFIYKGLTKPNPTVFMWRQADDQTRLADRSALVTGMVTGGGGAGAPAFVNFASREVNQWYDPDSNVASAIAAPGPYALKLEWNGPITTAGTLLALQYRQDPLSKAPVAYWFAFEPNVTLLSGQPLLQGPGLALMPAATDTVQGMISIPPKYSLLEKFIGLDFPGGVRFGVFRDTFSIGHLNYLYEVPDIADAHAQVCACAEDDLPPFLAARSIDCVAAIPAPNPRDLRIREAPEPYLPVNGGEGITYSNVFSWTQFEGGIHVVQFVPLATQLTDTCLIDGNGCGDDVDVDAAKFVVITAGTAATIPDLRSIGLGLDPAKDYRWRVRGMGPFGSVDDFTRYPVAVPPFDLPTAPEPDAFWARSRVYAFRTCGLSTCFAPVAVR